MTNHIAFIGVGNMGNPMADQLVKAGKEVKAFDVSPEVIKIAKEAGLNVVSTIDELLDGASTVISMLPEGKHVRSLYLGDKGILNKIPKECLIIDCSTIDIETSLELGNESKKLGIKMIDASIILIPSFFDSLPSSKEVSISIVEQSIIKHSFGILFNIPLSPK